MGGGGGPSLTPPNISVHFLSAAMSDEVRWCVCMWETECVCVCGRLGKYQGQQTGLQCVNTQHQQLPSSTLFNKCVFPALRWWLAHRWRTLEDLQRKKRVATIYVCMCVGARALWAPLVVFLFNRESNWLKVVGRIMLFLNCASCSILKESNTFFWPAKSMNKKRLVLAEHCANVLRGRRKEERE